MRITRLESFLTNAGLRNYLFLRLTTGTGLTGVGAMTWSMAGIPGAEASSHCRRNQGWSSM